MSKAIVDTRQILAKEYQRLLTSREQTGRIIWQQNPRFPEYSNPTMQILAGYISRSTFYGCPAILLYAPTGTAGEFVIFLGRVPSGRRRIGFEGYFGTYYENRNFTQLDIFLVWEENTGANNRWNSRVRIKAPWGATAALQYEDSGGTFTTFETDRAKIDPVYLPDSRRGVGWNHFKLVADFDENKYDKFIYNGNEWDLSDKDLYNLTAVEARNLHAEIAYIKVAGPVLPLRDLVITCDEP